MAYINPRFVPSEEEDTDREKRQKQFQATLLGLRKPPTDQSPYRRRASYIDQAGQAATLYETAKRNKREQAQLEAARKKAEQETIRQITLSVGQGQGPNLRGRYVPGTSYNSSYNPTNSGNSNLDALMQAIAGKESGGNYSAVNRHSGALGKYQIMPGNLSGRGRGWDYEALGRDVSAQEFLSNPSLQEAIAKYKMGQYYNQYGPRGTAIAWYAGPGAVSGYSQAALNAPQGQYPSISDYAADILRRLGL